MNLDSECVCCIINQSKRVCEHIQADEKLTETILSEITEMSKSFNFSQNPPQNATPVYQKMAQLALKHDLYDEVKCNSTQKAKSLLPQLKEKIKYSENPLLTATKVAVAGNVIDLAAAVTFDLDEELKKIFKSEFSCNDFLILKQKLKSAKTLLYLGDNVGEHIFDYLYIETLQKLYPQLIITYAVRGEPIINDVTLKEAKEAGFDSLCHLLDSGVDTPGFQYDRATVHAQKLFDNADFIISKGMGNYECLTPYPRKNIAFLLKVKCSVVASSLNQNIGDIICKVV
jgi:damage-control phosphatase, subfamily I